jgi:CDP-4-dehydro-6-deoxyglucose reductase
MTNGDSAVRHIRILPCGQYFPAHPGESTLDAGRRAGLAFPQACRNGNCLRCEGRLLMGSVQHLRSGHIAVAASGDTRAPGLANNPSADAPACPVLPCIVTALENCTLAVDGVLGPGEMPVITVCAQRVAITALNHNVARVQLRLPAGKKIARLAGQYLEIVDGDNAYAFSMACAPASGRDIELHVRYGEDNPSSLQVMALLRRESLINLRLPMGDCTLIGEPRLPLLLIAGSTGFAQVKAFVEHAIAQRWQVPMAVYWGARTPDDIYLPQLTEQWQREHANIRCVTVISGDGIAGKESAGAMTVTGTNDYRHGLAHDIALADCADLSSLLVYVCGSPPMVYAAQDAFVARGLPIERLFSDVFAWAPRPNSNP